MFDLPRYVVVEHGVRFENCRPVTFRFVRNMRSAARPTEEDPFQQSIEPAGRYMLHVPASYVPVPPSGWESGTTTFMCPLVLPLNTRYPEEIYGPHSWKAALHRLSGKKRGRALSRWLRSAGVDGIVTTIGSDETREIVAL